MNVIKRPTLILPLAVTLIACIVALLAPFWAYEWYSQPFIGAFLEVNNVVSMMGQSDWPVKQMGVQYPDRLIEADGQPVVEPDDLRAVLSKIKPAWVQLTFERPDGIHYRIVVTPRNLRLDELTVMFGIPYAVGLAFLATGLWAYRLGGQQRPARAFLLFTAAVSITTLSFLDMNTTHHFILGWTLSLPIAAGALAYLALVFPQQMPFIERYPATRFIPWVISAFFAFPGAREVLSPTDPWAYVQAWRWSYIYIAAAMLLFLTTLMVRIFRSHLAIVRQQSRIIIFGTALAFAPILLLYFVPIILGQTPVFQTILFLPSLVLLPLTVAYAIVRYRLLDVDRVLSKVVAYGLTTTAAMAVFYLLITALSFLLQRSLNPSNPLVIASYLLLLIVGMQPVHGLAQQAIDRLFYQTRADYRRVLTNLSRGLVITPDLKRILHLLDEELNAALSPERFILYLYDDDRRLYRPHSVQLPSDVFLPPRNSLVRLINQNQEATWFPLLSYPTLDSSASRTQGMRAEPQQVAIALGCQVFVPLRYEHRLIGFLALGSRRSGEPYSSEDLEFLSAVAGQSSLAVENARLFTNLQRTYEETLEMKNLMDDIFASIASGVITTDLKRKVTLFNLAAERILGITARDAIGRRLPDSVSLVGPELDAMAMSTIEHGLMVLNEELSPFSPETDPLFLRLSCTPLRDAHLGTKGATIVIDDLTQQRKLEAERERIRQTFGRVVAPRVRDRLLADPSNLRLDGVVQQISVMFADLHQFTPFSEKTSPEMLLAVLNSYLSLAAQAVLNEEGTLDKFIGDAVMAFWNAPDAQPDHALRAVRAALEVDRAIKLHRSTLEEDHQLDFSIGITMGEAMVGNVGTSQLFNYTAIGDTVNLAQRLESIADPGQILLTDAVYHSVAAHVIAQPLPAMHVKGREQEVLVYELLGLKGEEQAS